MKKITSIILVILFLLSLFTSVSAETEVMVLNEDYGKVKIQGKIQMNGSTAYAVRSSFGENETQDVIQYFVRDTAQSSSSGMEANPSFDFYPKQRLVEKSSSVVFENITVYGGDERPAISLSGFGYIGASHGMTCGVTVTSDAHGLTYSSIGNVYKDPAGVEWVLLRVSSENMLVFVSKNLRKGDDTNPTFYSTMGSTLTNVENAEEVIVVDNYSSGQQLRPSYKMTTQNIYVVNGEEKTLIQADGKTYEGDYVLAEEEYTIMNPVYVAQTIIDQRPEGGYTENPSLAVGKGLLTFELQQIYNADGTVVHNWDITFHQDTNLTMYCGVMWGTKGDIIYMPKTKPFTSSSSVSINGEKVNADSVDFDFTNRFDTNNGYPNKDITADKWEDPLYVPNRRIDYEKTGETYSKAFAGGQLPVFDNENSERLQNTERSFYMYNSRKAYFCSVGNKINERYPNLTDVKVKSSGYKKWFADYDDTYSYYSVPYFSDGDSSRYFYFDLYQPGITKKYDISAYLGTYSISELEKSSNLEYNIDYATGILTVSSLNNNQTSADYLILKAKYVGESVLAVEVKLQALPSLYNESVDDKLVEIAELMESVGAPESDYNPELLAKYKSLLAQKEAYEQAMKDEAANKDRVAGLDNRYEYVELYLFQDIFATYQERMSADWYGWSSGEITSIWPYKGITNNITPTYPRSRTAATNDWVMMIDLDGASSYPNAVSLKTNPKVSFDEKTERYFVNAENSKYKLGEIAEGKKGGNFATFGVKYDITSNTIADGLGIKEQTMNTSIYPNVGTSSAVTKGIYPINKSGLSKINLLLTTTQFANNTAMRLPVTIEYADGEKENLAVLVGSLTTDFQETVFAVPKTSKTYEEINTNKIVAKTILGKNVKNEDVTIPTVSGKLYLPEESFVLATQMRNYKGGEREGCVNSFSIPVNPEKTVKTITLENTASSITEAFTTSVANKETGNDRLAFVPITIKGASDEYDYYLHTLRACGSTGIFAMTLENAETWLDKIAVIEAKMLELSAEKSTVEDVEKTRKEIADLLVENTNIIYVKDFSAEARENIDNVEKALKNIKITAKAEADLEAVKVTVNNESKAEGIPYTVITVFYGKNPLGVKVNNFTTTKEENITHSIVMKDIPKDTESVKAFVWKDLMTIKPLSE